MQYRINSIATVIAAFAITFMTPQIEATTPKTSATDGRFRLMPVSKDAQLRRQLPRVDDKQIQAILNDPSLVFYTNAEMPSAYQDWSSGLPGVHSPSYNISANNSEPFGNGNVEFPWGGPGGTHRTRNVSTFRFFRLPKDDEGRLKPIVWYRRFLPGSSSQGYEWTFPVGTVVGEVLQMRSPWGTQYTFELRLRFREFGSWSVDVFRPFPTADSLAKRIRELRPNWSENEQLALLVNHLESPQDLKRHTLSDSSHGRPVFHTSMGIDKLPPVGDKKLVARLLSETVYRSALGSTWLTGENREYTVAPTTDAEFHIVPANYDAGFIEVDRASCMRCHETVNQHVNNFEFGRDWYGRIRGSDGIFSIHPFDPNCISQNGNSNSARINGHLVSAGILAKFDPEKHSTKDYQRLLQETATQ